MLANPGYALTQLLVNKEGDLSEKLLFLFQLFVPLAFLPFCVKRLSRLTLLFPLLLINLLTVYRYQFDLGFQYAFGTTAFLFYLCAINLTELREDTAKRVFAVSLFACALCFIIGPAARFLNYSSACLRDAETISVMNETLEEIPSDASVVCSTFLLPHLSERETLYEVRYHKPAEDERLDYVILDARFSYAEDREKYVGLGYTQERTVKSGDKTVLVILTDGTAE